MTWFRLDDGWLMHPKVRAIGKDARALWLAGGLHCASQLTDGRIDKHYLTVLAIQADVKPACHRRLVEQGLWIDNGDHWQMHDYADYQMTRADYDAERERKSKAGKSGAKKRWQRDSSSHSSSHTGAMAEGIGKDMPPTQPNPTQPNRGSTSTNHHLLSCRPRGRRWWRDRSTHHRSSNDRRSSRPRRA